MKRIQTFDLVRGFAILAVILIHRVFFDFYSQHGEAQVLSVGFFAFSLFSTMAGIFFCISGAVNTYVNYDRLKEGKLTSRQFLFRSFVTGITLTVIGLLFRYFLLRSVDNVVSVNALGEVLSYNETGVLPYMILYGVYPSKFNILILFQIGTIQMIGYSILAVSIIMVLYQKLRGLDDPERLRRFFLVLGIAVFLTSGLTYQFLWGPARRAIADQNFIAIFFLHPLVYGQFPIFPHFAFGFFGASFGVAFAQKDAEPKKILQSLLRFWVILLGLGVILLAITTTLELFDTWYFAWGRKLTQLGVYFFLFWLGMKFIDYQPEGTRESRMKSLNWLVTIGRVTLTVFILEGVVAVTLQRLIAPLWPAWNASVVNAALFGLINLAVWMVIIAIWKRVEFVGSVEWLYTWLVRSLSGKQTSKMDAIQT
ncbi:MAG: acyltransferase family protein [Anaerolineales bacterium]|nr:acyltransferase family protein [Anaerolineales bacterium]